MTRYFDLLIHDFHETGRLGTANEETRDRDATSPSLLTMPELRNRTLAPPPPRHPAVRPPSPNPQPFSNILNIPPPPVHPLHPSLPPRPPPSPRQDARLEHFGPEPTPPQATSLDTHHIPHTQTPPPPIPLNLPGDPPSFSENVVASTSNTDVEPIEPLDSPPQHRSISPEVPLPTSPASSINSITPVRHATEAGSSTLDPAYEATLSENGLRDLYDDEEIDRFLRFFSIVRCSLAPSDLSIHRVGSL